MARRFAQAIHAKYPGKLLAYTARRRSTGRKTSTTKLLPASAAAVGYGLQVPVYHSGGNPRMWFNMFDLANAYAQGEGMKTMLRKCNSRNSPLQKMAIPFFSPAGSGYGLLR